jgi:hypothetical protein
MKNLIIAECFYPHVNRVLYIFQGKNKQQVLQIISDDNLAGEACEEIIFHKIIKSHGKHEIDMLVLDKEELQND